LLPFLAALELELWKQPERREHPSVFILVTSAFKMYELGSSPQRVMRFNWRELLFREAREFTPPFYCCSTEAAKKKGLSRTG
jgi:hypothetical protein